MLPSPWTLRETEVNTIWKETLATLGYIEFDFKIHTPN